MIKDDSTRLRRSPDACLLALGGSKLSSDGGAPRSACVEGCFCCPISLLAPRKDISVGFEWQFSMRGRHVIVGDPPSGWSEGWSWTNADIDPFFLDALLPHGGGKAVLAERRDAPQSGR